MLAVDRDHLRDRLVESIPTTLPSIQRGLSELLQVLNGDVKPQIDVKPDLWAQPDEDVKPKITRDTDEDVKPDVRTLAGEDVKPEMDDPSRYTIDEDVKPSEHAEAKPAGEDIKCAQRLLTVLT